jgi:hypothetical protein
MKYIFQKWLFLLVVLAFLITFAASWHLHSYLAELAAIDMLESTLSGVSRKIGITEHNLKTVTHLSDAAALAKTHAFALLIASDPSILDSREKLDDIRKYVRHQLDNEIWQEEQRFDNSHPHYLDMSPAMFELKMNLLHECSK